MEPHFYEGRPQQEFTNNLMPQSTFLQWQIAKMTNDRMMLQASAPQQKPVSTATANRKAAIERFRAKRTQRSFEKKVRYTSRQRLAENRPRLKGQFTKAASQSGELAEATPSTELNTGNSDEAQL